MEPPSRKRGRPLKHSKIASSDTSKSRVAQDSSESNSVSPSTVAHVDLADRAVSPVDPRLSQRGRKKPVADKVCYGNVLLIAQRGAEFGDRIHLLDYGKDYDYDAPVKLLDKLLHSMSQTEDEQLVVVSQILVADINIGYEDIVITQVVVFNGTSVRNLKHLANLVEKCTDPFLRFDLDYQQIVVLET